MPGVPREQMLTQQDVDEIRREAATGVEQVVLAKRYGKSKQTINDIVRGRSWK